MRGLDSVLTLQSMARKLEIKLEVRTRWTPESEEWKRVDKSWQEREFDKAVDRLEGLVLARIFELEKMNQAGTCKWLQYACIFSQLIGGFLPRLQAARSNQQGPQIPFKGHIRGREVVQ